MLCFLYEKHASVLNLDAASLRHFLRLAVAEALLAVLLYKAHGNLIRGGRSLEVVQRFGAVVWL
jgi:hypothetical protein